MPPPAATPDASPSAPPVRDAAAVPPDPTPRPASPSASQAPRAADAAALRSFLAGAGLEHPDLSGENAADLIPAAGEAFREMVQGSRETLMARSTIKNELRLEATVYR